MVNVVWYFRNAPRCNGFELKDVSKDFAIDFLDNKIKKLRSWGKSVTKHHDGEFSYPLSDNKIGVNNVLVYQING